MPSASRRVRESPRPQGVNERQAYTVTTTPWGGGGSSPVVKVFDVTDGLPGDDVTEFTTTGSATIAGDVITTPIIRSLTDSHRYRVTVQWSKVSTVFECWFELLAEY